MIFILINSLQASTQLFSKDGKKYESDPSSNLMRQIKPMLHTFFSEAFKKTRESSFGMRHNKVTDVAAVLIKVLKPWNDYNPFQEAAVNLEVVGDP